MRKLITIATVLSVMVALLGTVWIVRTLGEKDAADALSSESRDVEDLARADDGKIDPLKLAYANYEKGALVKAAKQYQELAENGDPVGQRNLGFLYQRGHGVNRNNATAMMWYLKAAEQGHRAAYNNIGFLYVAGLGVEQDFVQAHLWYTKAVVAGSKEGKRLRSVIQKKMTDEQVAAAEKLEMESGLKEEVF